MTEKGCRLFWSTRREKLAAPPVPYAVRPIVVDGNLAEWKGSEGVDYQPFDASLTTDARPTVRKLQSQPSSAKVCFSYDTEALYVAIDWKGSHPAQNSADVLAASNWWKSGDGIELHLIVDQSIHVASWPVNGSTSATAIRVGDRAIGRKPRKPESPARSFQIQQETATRRK